jgi:hypothetical protein
MAPAVTRIELNNADDIIAEPRVVPIRRRQVNGVGTSDSACKGKSGFEAKSMADVAARRLAGLSSYRCPHCRLWHVGNRNKG